MRNKIEAGEYVELDRLLPKENAVGLGCTLEGGENFMQLVNRDGQMYFAPAKSSAGCINGIKKWDQAFRVYAAIYSEGNPG